MPAHDRSAVTVIGLGPMGRALAGAFLRNGHPTTVWNRTPGKADPLVARGAFRAGTAAEAVTAGPLTVVCVIDYAAVRAVVEPVADELKGRTLVNLTADSPARAREMAEWASRHGIRYLDGCIMSPTTTIGGPSATVIYSGPEEVFQDHRETLTSLGGTPTHLGADPGRAAAWDVALLSMFWTSMSGIAHAFAMAGAEGIPAGEFAPFAKGIGEILPPIVDEFAADVAAGRYPGDDSTLESAAAGMDHVVDAADDYGLDTSVIRAARDVARRAIDAGHGAEGFSRLVEELGAARTAG